MPELPEVETIRSQLSQQLPLKIKMVKQTAGLKKNILKSKIDLNDKTLIKIDRKGKVLIFIFEDGSTMLSHLGMTGTWLIGEEVHLTKHSHLILSGLNKSKKDFIFAYDDPRRFGKIYFSEKINQSTDNSKSKLSLVEKKLAELGLDLLDPQLDLDYLEHALQKFPERALKVTLLDQKLFAGSGNYIASEICARAKILPTRLCKNIKSPEYVLILKAIDEVVTLALKSGGTTFQGGYRDSSGEAGLGKSNLVVFYQKTCQMCKKNLVTKIMLNQRGTYFCSICQK